MTDEQKDKLILCWIETLAKSQGMYGRLLVAINEADEESREEFFSQYRGCRTMMDFIMEFEC